MKVHHLHCGAFCPRLGNCVVIHCLLVETPSDGLLLVDTGFGDALTADPMKMPWTARWLFRPDLRPTDSALQQVQAMGHRPSDVRHIVVTHLDGDHAGGLADFPNATVHVHAPELEAARAGNDRYDPGLFTSGIRWASHAIEGDTWAGLECVHPLEGLRDEIALVPLAGHTLGHAGVAVESDGGWLLHAGDAYLISEEVHGDRRLSLQTKLAAWFTSASPSLRRRNVERLRKLAATRPDIRIISSHDPRELDALRPNARTGGVKAAE